MYVIELLHIIQVIKRLCIEFSNEYKNVIVDSSVNVRKEGSGHAGMEETSLMMYYNKSWVAIDRLPPDNIKLKYSEFGIVDSEGASGKPGEGFAVNNHLDPRTKSTAEMGRELSKKTVSSFEQHIRKLIK